MEFDKYFREDDYDEINEKYFNAIRKSGVVKADPSGWLDTIANSYEFVQDIVFNFNEVQRYYADEGLTLKPQKEAILQLISLWENREYRYDEVTFCHSATAGSLITLDVLKRKGVKNIIFETPCYFASVGQAKALNLNCILYPTFYSENFFFDLNKKTIEKYSPCAIWITQPRMSLGYNQKDSHISSLLTNLSNKDYLIVDEATEQYFPSHLYAFSPVDKANIIKIRCMFKGTGLNGIRMSFIMHPEELRDLMVNAMDLFQGAIDYFSLKIAFNMAQNPLKFKAMLEVSNLQTTGLRSKAEKLISNENLTISNLVNGYVGCTVLNMKDFKGTHHEKKENFLKYCQRERTPVILGASMKFSFHENVEFVRMNYYSREHNIIEGLKTFSRFLDGG
ncbi:MAG: hypothetical protein JSV88_01900 [Candidatus Aminicenantes bacterium]|nr:MAG: hypothetical protein JSV88_01900 [Candidatus Aminicenantes bacterium]